MEEFRPGEWKEYQKSTGNFKRHFMSTSELDMTDPATFLWSPTRSLRERLGLQRVNDTVPAITPGRESPEDFSGLFAEVEDLKPDRSGKKGKGFRRKDPQEDFQTLDEEPPEIPEPEPSAKPKVRAAKQSEEALAKIDAGVAKYEQQTWDRLHVEQEAIRKRLFSQWAQNPNSMTSKEYHKMLSKMHKLARSSMPGDLKPGDTLATLQYMLDASKGPGEKERKVEKAESFSKLDRDEELTLTYAAWQHCMSGRARPEVSQAKECSQEKHPAASGVC
ncbi:unnamed protein product [Effrenium voratum]|uniref:Uncharacterized protein n=1 Tax=Effrenium voratum TaxID=2562239 RepID=A0AA36IMX4_9DINO|nr:unnamed protein product [Effrenium voratum]